jgi:hypothetical protein
MADEDIWADNWNLDEYGGVDSQEDYLTYGATDYYQRAFDPDARGASYAALGPTQQEGPREGQQKNLQSFTMEAAGEPATPQDSQPGGGQPLTSVPSQYLMGEPEKVKENVDVLTEGAGLTRSQGIFQNAVTRAAAGFSSLKERAGELFSRSRGG